MGPRRRLGDLELGYGKERIGSTTSKVGCYAMDEKLCNHAISSQPRLVGGATSPYAQEQEKRAAECRLQLPWRHAQFSETSSM